MSAARRSVLTAPPSEVQEIAVPVKTVKAARVGVYCLCLLVLSLVAAARLCQDPPGSSASPGFAPFAVAFWLLNPMDWMGAALLLPVFVALHTFLTVAGFRLIGARPIRSGLSISAPGTWFTRPQYLVPFVLSLLVVCGLGGWGIFFAPPALPVRGFPLSVWPVGCLLLSLPAYLVGCLPNLRTIRRVFQVPAGAMYEDVPNGFRYFLDRSR